MQHADLRRGEADAERVVHQLPHALDLVCAARRRSARPAARLRAAPGRRSGARARARRRGAPASRGRARSARSGCVLLDARPRRSSLGRCLGQPPAAPVYRPRVARYCGSTSTLKLTPRARGRSATAPTAPPTARTAARRSARLDDEHLALAPAQPEQRRRAEQLRRSRRPAGAGVAQRAARRAAARAGRLGGGADDPDQVREGRVARAPRRRSSSPAMKPSLSWRAASTIARASGAIVCTSTRPLAAPARAPGELRDQRERALLGAEVGEAQGGVGVEHDAERARRGSRGPWRPSACRSARPRAAASKRRSIAAARRARRRRSVGVEPEHREARRRRSIAESSCCEALGAGAVARDRASSRSRRSARAPPRDGRSDGRPGSRRRGAGRARRRTRGQLQTRPQERQERKFDQPRRFSSTIALPRAGAHLGERLGGVAGAGLRLLAHVEDLRPPGSGRPSTRRAQAQAGSRCTLSGRGVALPQQQHARRARRARSAATSRAS